ncbi:Dorsal-ventral patterning protein tolloid [Folsomia candida]|uniref:Dorsal-ventral patterning protein tolloid n=1 Tax=Folsomia candida TaxID=158441 RepID=A0A226F6R1_FOLCA|nr:Dorsal-ventral patterning protein tolloid [Folsomia candida]
MPQTRKIHNDFIILLRKTFSHDPMGVTTKNVVKSLKGVATKNVLHDSKGGAHEKRSVTTLWPPHSLTREEPRTLNPCLEVRRKINVTTCGGFVNASSASIEFQLGGSIRADMRCVWIVQAPSSAQRFSLVASGLKETDGLYVTPLARAAPTQKLGTLGQNIILQSKSVLITLIVGHAPTLGFKMEYYASGSNVNPDITGVEILTTAKGNLTYPRNGGIYRPYETAVFPIAPSVPGQPTIRFTRMDLESDSLCAYDWIRIYNWFEDDYRQVARFCGNTIPTSATFQDGVGFVLFSSDSSVFKTGFDFQYE